MTQDKSGARSSAVKLLLIRAWRERWTPSQYGTQIKSVMGRGVSAEDIGLAEHLIQLSMNGPSPNQLLLSLLDHSLASQLVTYSEVLVSLSRFSDHSRPHCTAAILKLIHQHRPFITSRGGEEECLNLGTSVVSIATWIINTVCSTIDRLASVRDSKVDLSNLQKSLELLDWLLEDKFISSLLYTGRFEDQELHQDFILATKGLGKMSDQIYKFHGGAENEENPLQAKVLDLSQKLKTSDPAFNLYNDEERPDLILTLQSLISYDVLLQPTSNLNQLSGQLVVIMNIRNVSLSTLVCEITRCCLLGMNDSDRFDVLRWDAFTMLKLHRLIEKILIEAKMKDGVEGVVYHGMMQLLQYTSLLDMTDARCKANTFDLILTSFSPEKRKQAPLVTDTECKQLKTARGKQLEARKHVEIKTSSAYSDSRDVNMTLKADSTLQTIINTFENRTTDSNEFDNLLSVMFHIVKGSSFDLLLSAASANGTLAALVSKLLFFNKGTQESLGESTKVAVNRAALFDMTFLMLVYMVQCFSSSVLLGADDDDDGSGTGQDGFFPRWARQCMAEPGHVKPLEAFKDLGGAESLVDGLLQQMIQGEIRTQVVMWNQVCSSVHDVMKEILVGVEMGSINTETYNRLTSQLCNKLCCFPIFISSWLVSTAHFGEGEAKGRRPSALAVIDRFINASCAEEDIDTRPYFSKRSTMMVNILKKMRREMEPPVPATDGIGGSNGAGSATAHLSVAFDKLWDKVWEKRMLDIAATKEIARLFNIGGAQWLMDILVEKIRSQVYKEDVSRCTEMVFSIIHIDLPACTLSLLLYIIPNILRGNGWKEGLCYPAGNALARLTVSSLAAVLKLQNSGPYTIKRKLRSVELDDLCNNHSQPVKLRKLAPNEAMPVDPSPTQEQLIQQAHVGLFELLSGVCAESTLSPKLEFVSCILEECVKLGREDSIMLLKPLSVDLTTHLIKLVPDRFPVETMLRFFDPNEQPGRKNILTSLCLLRNIKAKTRVVE